MRGGFTYWLDVTTTENINRLVSYYLLYIFISVYRIKHILYTILRVNSYVN